MESDSEAALDKQRREMHTKLRDELLKRQLSNNENYDRAILTLSSAALGLTATFVKGTGCFKNVEFLVFSWILLVLAITLTLASYAVSQKAIAIQLNLAQRYYVHGDDSAAETPNWASQWHEYIVFGSGVCFVLGVILSLLFFHRNL